MTNDESGKFRNIMAGMCRMYGQEPDKLVLDAYWLALKSWSLADFEQAAGHLMATSEFMPKPADFNELRKAGRPTAGEAWAKVLQAVRTSSYDNGIDPLIDRVAAACGGYHAIGQTTDEGLPFMERRFAEHFENLQDAADTREAVPQITRTRETLKLGGPKSVAAVLAKLTDQTRPTDPA